MAAGSDTHTRRCARLLAIVGLVYDAGNKLLLSSTSASNMENINGSHVWLLRLCLQVVLHLDRHKRTLPAFSMLPMNLSPCLE